MTLTIERSIERTLDNRRTGKANAYTILRIPVLANIPIFLRVFIAVGDYGARCITSVRTPAQRQTLEMHRQGRAI